MSWSTPQSGLFVAHGQAVQVTYDFGGTYRGPQYTVAKLDRSSGGSSGEDKFLIVQWNAVVNRPTFGGYWYYALGVSNPSSSDVWYHLEGGGIT